MITFICSTKVNKCKVDELWVLLCSTMQVLQHTVKLPCVSANHSLRLLLLTILGLYYNNTIYVHVHIHYTVYIHVHVYICEDNLGNAAKFIYCLPLDIEFH